MEQFQLKHFLKNPENRSLVLFSSLAFLLPFSLWATFNLVGIVFIAHAFFSASKSDHRKALKQPIFLWLSAFFIYQIIRNFWTASPEKGWNILSMQWPWWVLTYTVFLRKPDFTKVNLHKILRAFSYGLSVAALVCLGYAVFNIFSNGSLYLEGEGGVKSYYFLYTRLAKPLMHPGYLATLFGLGTLSSLGLYFLRGKKLLDLFSAGFFFLFVFLLQGRINLLALFVVLGLGFLVLLLKKMKPSLIAIPVLLALGFFAFVRLSPDAVKKRYIQVPSFEYDITAPNIQDFTSFTVRLAEWKNVFLSLEDNRTFGVGLGDMEKSLLNAYQETGFIVGYEGKFNAHNQYLQFLLGGGYVGLFIFMGYFLSLLWKGLQQRNRLGLGMLLFFALCLVTESMLQRYMGVATWVFFFPLLFLSGTQKSA